MLFALLLSSALAGPWEEVAATAGMEVGEVRALLDGVTRDPTVLERMARPWEAQPWHVYWTLFSDPERVRAGVAFWEAHAAALAAAEARTGVPASVVVAILGVESRYGAVMGGDPVLRSLYTLGFFHPRRGAFFRAELGHFLRLAADEGWDLAEVRGSYAGAMGMGQFIPSSYRRYAVDGDGDGTRDLFHSPDDAIASVANYFAEHGWVRGGPVLLPADAPAPADDPDARRYAFELADGTSEELLGRHNFQVIQRYNHSPLYARAVHELSVRLAEARAEAR